MKKPYLLTLVFCAIAFFSFSQNEESLVKAGSKGLYITHEITAKENFYSIGRAFNVHPKHLAAFNALDMSKGLSLGQVINIPLSDTNFNRSENKGTPLYYKSTQKQTVGTISAISKTQADKIRQWNHVNNNEIAAGTPVIIGYLDNGTETPAPVFASAKSVVPSEPVKPKEEKKDLPTVQKPKPEEKTTTVVKTANVKEEPKAVKTEPKTVAKTESSKNTITVTGDGYFKTYFANQVKKYPLSKEEVVTSGIFKTTTGWNDGKYYALIDGVEPGTVIKVINPANSKIIYAKVLGQMSGIKQDAGLNLRISNAAASVLDVEETGKFIVKVNY